MLGSTKIKQARDLLKAKRSDNYVGFFRVLDEAGVLIRCLMSPHIKRMLHKAINVGTRLWADGRVHKAWLHFFTPVTAGCALIACAFQRAKVRVHGLKMYSVSPRVLHPARPFGRTACSPFMQFLQPVSATCFDNGSSKTVHGASAFLSSLPVSDGLRFNTICLRVACHQCPYRC